MKKIQAYFKKTSKKRKFAQKINMQFSSQIPLCLLARIPIEDVRFAKNMIEC